MDWRSQSLDRSTSENYRKILESPQCVETRTDQSKTASVASFVSPTNSVDTRIIIDLVKTYISERDLMRYRRVSKQFCEVVQNYPKVTNSRVFHVAGKHPRYKSIKPTEPRPNPIRVLLESDFPWNHVKFTQVNLEQDLLGQEDLFQKFTTQICLKSLKSLELIDCYCGMGRFIELIPFCHHLDQLKIISCPAIFEAGPEIMNWRSFFPPFQRRLSQIKHFTVIDTRRAKSILNTSTINFWMGNMRQLLSLDLRSSFGDFPIDSIVPVITRNRNTLRNLSIVAKCELGGKLVVELSKVKLQSLRLGNFKLESYNGLDGFLKKQAETLESLHFFNMTIHVGCIGTIADFNKLWQLHFEDVHFVGFATQDSDGAHPLAKLSGLKDLRLQDTQKRSCIQWIPLLKSETFRLTTLVFRYTDVHILLNLFSQQCLENLKTFVIMDLGRNQAQSNFVMRNNFIASMMQLNTLEKLEITDSAFTDSDFQPQEQFVTAGKSLTLKALTHLVMLNLSRMSVGDDVFLKCIIKIRSLEALYMDETLLSVNALKELSVRRTSFKIFRNRRGPKLPILPKLRFLSARRCPWIKLTVEEAMRYSHGLRLPHFYCDLQDL